MAKYVSSFTQRNNYVGGTIGGGNTNTVATVEKIDTNFQHFDFGIRWVGADGAGVYDAGHANRPWVGISAGIVDGDDTFFNPSVAEIYLQWDTGTLAGTFKERWFMGPPLTGGAAVEITNASRDNVDPGFGAIDTSGTTAPTGRVGPRYRIELFDSYYRCWVIGDDRPRALIPAPSTGFPLPTRLAAALPNANFAIHNIEIGGSLLPSALYTKEAQVADGVTTPVYLRIYQKSRYAGIQGIPTDLTIT